MYFCIYNNTISLDLIILLFPNPNSKNPKNKKIHNYANNYIFLMNSKAKNSKNTAEICFEILEENGGKVAEKSRKIMLADPKLKTLKDPFQFIATNWRDPLTPSLLSLSCEAVGEDPIKTNDLAIALSLINLTFFLWDDIIDSSYSKHFKATLTGKYGTGIALITGGMISAKAFTILNNLKIQQEKKELINQNIWNLLSLMAKAETHSIKMRTKGRYSSKIKLWKIETESIDPEICLRIGALIGDGSEREIENLGTYGKCLGIIIGLINDFRIGTNLTLELAEKIKLNVPPYCLLLASENSISFKKVLEKAFSKEELNPKSIELIVKSMLKTGIYEEIEKKVVYWVEKANKAIENLNQNRATQTLLKFIQLQPKYFLESIHL